MCYSSAYHARVQSSTCTNYEKYIMAVLTSKSVTIQLTGFTAFKIGRKLNSVCCNYVHFSHQPLVLSLKGEFFASLLSNNCHTMDSLIIFMHINQDQFFWWWHWRRFQLSQTFRDCVDIKHLAPMCRNTICPKLKLFLPLLKKALNFYFFIHQTCLSTN